MATTILTSADKLALANELNAAADKLEAEMAIPGADMVALDAQATALRNQAERAIAAAIILRGQAVNINTEQLANAIKHCNQVIDRVNGFRKKIAVATALVSFFGVVLTGDIVKIVQAGVALDKKLDQIEQA